MRINSLSVFLGASVVFMTLTLTAALFGPAGGVLWQVLIATAISALCVVATYTVLNLSFRPRQVEHTEWKPGYAVMWWGSAALGIIACIIFVVYGQASPPVEAIKRLVVPGYVPAHDMLEVRLATALMPRWAEGLFEVARRFAVPLAAILIVVGRVRADWWRVALLAFVGLFLIISTADRSMPMLYAALIYGARALTLGWGIFRDRWLLVVLVFAVGSFVGLKTVQYGEFYGFGSTGNLEIAEVFGGVDPELIEQAKTGKEPSERALQTVVAEDEIGPVHRVFYMARSLYERLALSSVAMAAYAFSEYDESNFQHWRSTRILSVLGIGRYVDPLEKPTSTTHHDAFPVTYIGDLWRQGGYFYIPIYSVLLGALLVLLDRVFFGRRAVVWQPFILLAVVFLFYANAINATSVMMIGGSFAGLTFLRLAGIIKARRMGQVSA